MANVPFNFFNVITKRMLDIGNGEHAEVVAALGLGGCYATGQFTPTAAGYTAGDVVGGSVEFALKFSDGSAVPAGSVVRLLAAVSRIDTTGLRSSEGAYNLRLYSATQPSAQADNDAWTLASADLDAYLGSIALGTPVDEGASLYVRSAYLDHDLRLVTSSLWGRLQTVAAPTLTAVAHKVTLLGSVL